MKCQTCNGHGEVGGFVGGAAPGWETEECPSCHGSGCEPMDVESMLLAQLAALNKSYQSAAEPIIKQLCKVRAAYPPPPMVIFHDEIDPEVLAKLCPEIAVFEPGAK